MVNNNNKKKKRFHTVSTLGVNRNQMIITYHDIFFVAFSNVNYSMCRRWKLLQKGQSVHCVQRNRQSFQHPKMKHCYHHEDLVNTVTLEP